MGRLILGIKITTRRNTSECKKKREERSSVTLGTPSTSVALALKISYRENKYSRGVEI